MPIIFPAVGGWRCGRGLLRRGVGNCSHIRHDRLLRGHETPNFVSLDEARESQELGDILNEMGRLYGSYQVLLAGSHYFNIIKTYA